MSKMNIAIDWQTRRLMNKATKFALIISFCFCQGLALAKECHIDDRAKLVSLSAPVTYVLKWLNLLEDKNLLGVSALHHVEIEEKRLWNGGIFLSSSKLRELKRTILFFDQSRELERSLNNALKKNADNKLIKIATRGMAPFAVNDQATAKLRPYLTNCDQALEKLEHETKKIKESLKKFSIFSRERTVIFFLGEISPQGRLPELVMANDGFVKSLLEHAAIKSYPSELSYLSWSQKVLEKIELPLFLGVSAAGKDLKISRVKEGYYNLTHPGALTPGLGQIHFLQSLINSDEVLK